MNISSLRQSGVNLIDSAQYKTENASRDIAGLFKQNTGSGEVEYNSSDLIKPVLDLKRAELETSAAAKLIEADQKMMGSILDIKA